MDWGSERYVRVYTRDTIDWKLLSWQARALLLFILRRCTRAGLIDLGNHGRRGLGIHVEMPAEALEPALDELLADGCVRIEGGLLEVPNFVVAQEAIASDALRCRDYRARKKLHDTYRVADDTTCVASDTKRPSVTRDDTPYRTVPNRTVPNRPEETHAADAAGSGAPADARPRAKKPTGSALDASEPSGYPEVLRAYWDAFQAHHGAKPTWGPVEGRQLKGLLAKSSADEILRRLAIFYGPGCPRWIAEGGRDWSAFHRHFNAVASPTQGGNGVIKLHGGGPSAADVARDAYELERQGK